MPLNPQIIIKTISNLYPEFKLLKKDHSNQALIYHGFLDSIHLPEINPYLTQSKIQITAFDYDQGKTIIHYAEKTSESLATPAPLTLN